MVITLNNKDHSYLVDGEFASITITELLQKHGLAPDYSFVKKSVSDKKKNEGSKIHEDLEKICNSNRYQPQSLQGQQFRAWANENLIGAIAEQRLALKRGDLIIAGTADIFAVDRNNNKIIADHKNMESLHKESVAWQVSLYDYMARQLGDEEINGKKLSWTGADKFLCFQYAKGKMKTIELEKIPDEEIERLIWCEMNNEIYSPPKLELSATMTEQIVKAENALIQAQYAVKVAEENAKVLRESLIKAMKEKGVKSWETDSIKITYVAPTERQTVDTKLLQSLYPLQYMNCIKVSPVKEKVVITVKNV